MDIRSLEDLNRTIGSIPASHYVGGISYDFESKLLFWTVEACADRGVYRANFDTSDDHRIVYSREGLKSTEHHYLG